MNEATETTKRDALAGSAGGALLAPTRGLTLRKGKTEVNVHEVIDNTVYYGVYIDGEESPIGTFRTRLSEWNRLTDKALSEGAAAFMFLGANAMLRCAGRALSRRDQRNPPTQV